MAKDLFNRYIWLVDSIYRKAEGLTFEEINEKWVRSVSSDGNPIPLRTFHNHRDAIEELFDINIECNKSTYRYYIDNSEDLASGGVRRWLLNTFAVNNLIKESQKLKQRILFEDIPSGQQFLTTIIEAMRDGVKLKMKYQSYGMDRSAEFDIEPYFVKVFKQRWYVIGKSDLLRIYALDRVVSLTPTPKKFNMPVDFDPEEYFNHCYGIIRDEGSKPQEIILKTSSGQANYLRTLPLHHSQLEIESLKDYSVFTYFIKPTFDFRHEILSLGNDAEVLAPETFRNEMKKIAGKMSEIYKSNTI
jgi:hypothetical protein